MVRSPSPPQERLSRTAIVDSALRLADTEGLDAVTIRRLASDHGVTPMALYWHFADKAALLDGLTERLLAEVRFPADPVGAWDEQLELAQNAFLSVIRAHPNLATLPLTRMLDSDEGLRVTENTLRLLHAGGFSPEDAAELGSYLLNAIVALVTSEPGPERVLDGEPRAAAVSARRAQLLSLATDAFPTVVAAADALADCRSQDDYYSRGIDVLIRGIVSLRDATATGAAPEAPAGAPASPTAE
jgi:AcrR family transcriptional regulator